MVNLCAIRDAQKIKVYLLKLQEPSSTFKCTIESSNELENAATSRLTTEHRLLYTGKTRHFKDL